MADYLGKLDVAPGVVRWSGCLDPQEQASLVADVFARACEAPFYRPRMPRSGKSFSVEETNFGALGWYSDESGYRYETRHPETRRPWPPMPQILCTLWHRLTNYAAPAECCLVNLYRGDARMGLHQDRDEAALDAPVLSISLGDEAIFRMGGVTRRSATRSLKLKSGDVVMFGGVARLAYHGIDRVIANTSSLLPGGGRLNLTLRRVSKIEDARPGG
ncbi:MAG TPA: alpha-ketoglutarate-dependent dioxygenase AlkB [Rhizomicrobium sp.]